MGLLDNMKLAMQGFKPDEIRSFNESGIKSDEIIELSKNGYTAKDIQDLLAISADDGADSTAQEDKESEQSEQDSGNKSEEDDSDYKKQLDEKNAELEKLRKQIEDVQVKNASKNLGGGKQQTSREIIQEAFRNLY